MGLGETLIRGVGGRWASGNTRTKGYLYQNQPVLTGLGADPLSPIQTCALLVARALRQSTGQGPQTLAEVYADWCTLTAEGTAPTLIDTVGSAPVRVNLALLSLTSTVLRRRGFDPVPRRWVIERSRPGRRQAGIQDISGESHVHIAGVPFTTVRLCARFANSRGRDRRS